MVISATLSSGKQKDSKLRKGKLREDKLKEDKLKVDKLREDNMKEDILKKSTDQIKDSYSKEANEIKRPFLFLRILPPPTSIKD
ncbi:hypothetical protein POVCU2_0097580 [Plasmodium ovale curtisi]|uniref:Uncharacterized protein n=1 Tax=Plasmodium ovale curtisi TaxID=864141 RepID=A0A1A8WTI9_PLAOA|nr:hypothetical protein POVCU2_0097580 [Plasmodium ovale curtisi]SBS97523.1 hypothetical protein POVCU1_038880 [Plasmodium ovale curtisi]